MVSCSDELAVHSYPPPLPAEVGCERCERVVLLLVFIILRNSNMATNLQRFTSCYGSRRFDC